MEFKINTEFAKKFNERKQREELQKLKSKYEDEDDDESTSESEDEEAKALTQQLDKKWFLTLAAIKSKNPKIYDPKVNFFDKVEDGTNSSSSSSSSSSPKPTKKKNTKSCLLNDYQNKFLIEKGGIESNSEEEEDDDEKVDENIDGGGGGGGGGDGLTRGWIQNDDSDLKESIKMLSKDDDDEDGEELFRMTSGKQGTRSKGDDGDVSHVSWLKGQQDDLDDMEAVEVLKPLKQKWTSANLDEDEKFLRDYILEQKYLNHDDDDDHGDDGDDDSCDDDKEDGDKKGKDDDDDEGGILKKKTTTMKNDDDDEEEDEEEEERREAEFEHKYNYRFEEPDALFIKSYPRTIADTVRRQEKKRRMEKRRELEDRKNQEKLKKKAEMERYAKLKKKEEDKKLKKLEKVRGGSINTSLVNLDGDFDAEEHDRFMKKNFGKKFYEGMDYGEDDDDKPDFKNLDSDNEYYDWDEWDGATRNDNDDDNDNDDNDNDEEEDENENTKNNYDGTGKEKIKKKKKSKKKKSKDPPPVKCQSKFAVALERNRNKPVFDPSKKSFETYVSTYYKLECEDEIDGAPCRFKYKNVFPADYGLSTDEVLEAPDQELNAWVPIKRINACKTDEEEILLDRVIRKKKRKNKVLKSLYAEPIVEKAKDENVQENIERIFKTDSKIIKNKPPNSVMCPEPKSKKIKLSNNEKEGNDLATEKAEIKTGKKKSADGKKKLQTEIVEETNKPMKRKDSKHRRKEKPKLTLSAARLAAYNIDPKKFKYYYLPKMQQVK